MLPNKFQASEPGSSEEEGFRLFSHVHLFLWLIPGPSGRNYFGPWDLHLYKLDKEPLGKATYQVSSI